MDTNTSVSIADLVEATGLPPLTDIRDALPSLPPRPMSALLRERINTIGILACRDDDSLLDIRNFGPRCLNEVKTALANLATTRSTREA